ncbi:MAG: FAD-dependent oxidoreductase [Coriobacteriia bacterium]
MSEKGIERREFLKTAALAGAAVAGASVLSGCSGGGSSSGGGGNWDQTADVVIIGGGGSGLAAAIEASDNGASVLVIEKDAKTGGTTSLSGGVIQAAGTQYQKEFTQYQDDTTDKHAQTWIIEGEGLVDEELVNDLAAGMPEHIEWLTGLGLEYTSVYGHCHVPYLDAEVFADRIHVYEGGGGALGGTVQTDALKKAADDKGVEFVLSTEVTQIIMDGDNGAVGVQDANGKRYGANKGVIIATASIDRNNDLAKAICPQQYWDNTSQQVLISEMATGDGIRMGMEVGADLSLCGGTIDFDGVTGIGTTNASPQIACIFVNAAGKRFVTEDATYAYHYRAIYQQNMMWQAPTYMILDSAGVEGPASPWAGGKAADAVSQNVLIQAASIQELASKIAVPAEALTATLDEWNQNISATGTDVVFQRNTQLVPINTPPFYAMKQVSYNLGSLGGLKINVDTQVIDIHGDPIPHLFAAGLSAGGWMGPYYPGSGTAVAGTVHWGRKAGRNAAAA